MLRNTSPADKRLKLQEDSPLVTFAHPSNTTTQLPTSVSTPVSPPTAPPAAQIFGSDPASPRVEFETPDGVSSEAPLRPSQETISKLRSSYPSFSLPAQPVVDDQEAVRASSRNKKPTKFFGDPLRHSVKLVEEVSDSQPSMQGPPEELSPGFCPLSFVLPVETTHSRQTPR